MARRVWGLLAALCLTGWSQTCAAPPEPSAGAEAAGITWLVRDSGGRVDWSADGAWLAFDRLGDDGSFDVWTMRPDGSDQTCLTCDTPGLPQGHVGNPAWHPSGEFLVVQALNTTVEAPLGQTGLYRIYTNPGAGFHNELWLVSRDGRQAWQVTTLADSLGVLHPHFSHDGGRLVWAAMRDTAPGPIGTWDIALADVSVAAGAPALSNLRAVQPGALQWVEPHGFSPDDTAIVLSGMPEGGTERDFDIYRYSLAGGQLTALTGDRPGEWDEHAHLSPDGTRVVWMSSRDIPRRGQRLSQFTVKTDYWVMAADGSDKRRLTRFNDPAAPEYIAGQVIAADFAFSPDGRRMAAYIQDNPTAGKPGSIAILALDRTAE